MKLIPLTALLRFGCIGCVKGLVVALLALFVLCSCDTLVTRRSLYSPDPEPGSWEWNRRMTGQTVTTTTTTTTEQETPAGIYR